MLRPISVLLLTLAATTTFAGTLTEQFEKSLRSTVLNWTSDTQLEGPAGLNATVLVPKDGKASFATLAIVHRTRTPVMEPCGEITWKVDGTVANEGYGELQVDDETSSEKVVMTVDLGLFKTLATGGKVEFSSCGLEGTVSEADQKGLQAILGKI
ncbi:hypothetical protein PHLH8_20360 [Pseudomonas sp. Pc102]|uniref:hypothetical protein n=1 Tax=Pseudomonas sp. Pc102 TaxID=2678261 RepID=UPI001BCB7CAF|nr:hypothetical protein [Pseudomonas sp. Pc102]BBP82394.1 hypothetical protein PHLH8_20360 [Pseudomonas sp. Pc102]